MSTTYEPAGELAAIENRYAELLQELADLYHVRAQLKRAAAERGAAEPATDEAHAAEPGELVVGTPRRGKAKGGKESLRMLTGGVGQAGDESFVNPAHRLASKQGTRAQLCLMTGGRAAS